MFVTVSYRAWDLLVKLGLLSRPGSFCVHSAGVKHAAEFSAFNVGAGDEIWIPMRTWQAIFQGSLLQIVSVALTH